MRPLNIKGEKVSLICLPFSMHLLKYRDGFNSYTSDHIPTHPTDYINVLEHKDR